MALALPKPLRFAALLALLLASVNVAGADANQLVVAPGGNSASCTVLVPCSIIQATTAAAPGDQIVLKPGNYIDTGSDLGPERRVEVPSGVSMHGVLGSPRPVITLTTNLQFGLSAIGVRKNASVSHLDIESDDVPFAISIQGTAEDLIVRSDADNALPCRITEGVLRDSACLSLGGAQAIALGADIGTLGPLAPISIQLRNVTAIATGAQSIGIRFAFIGIFGGGMTGQNVRTINSIGVIAHGTEGDVEAISLSPDPHPAGSGAVMALTFANSAYADVTGLTDFPAAGGSSTITPAGSGTNIKAAPLLAPDLIHQLPLSPTVDAGAVDAISGSTSLDEQPRKIGSAPDIGADEFTGSTITTIACKLQRVELGRATACTATVANDFGTLAPTGTLSFASSGAGAFNVKDPCVLGSVDEGKVGCRFTYKPSKSGAHKLTASYGGDGAHTASKGALALRVVTADDARLDTKLKHVPRRKTGQRRARFTFVSVPAGAHFQCKLDRARFKSCRSPFKAKVKPGKHVFRVRAVGPGGATDATPATYRWKVAG